MKVILEAIGTIKSTRKSRDDDNWEEEICFVELGERFTAESLKGVEQFSHIEIIFYMHEIDDSKVVTGTRVPRGDDRYPETGIFAQRGSARPNKLGLSVARVTRIDGRRLYLEGLDAIDGTPVFDIKPWVVEFGPRGPVYQPKWMSELMKDYWRKE